MSDDELDWMVDLIDPGCDCCSFVNVAAFATEAEAKKWVRGVGRPSNYSIQYIGDDEDEPDWFPAGQDIPVPRP